MKGLVILIGILQVVVTTGAQAPDSIRKGKLIFADNFSKPAIGTNWFVETAEHETGGYLVRDGKLELNTKEGITVWYKNKLSGNYLIEYDRSVVMGHGANDRLSDLNQFWMATDPQQNMFTRKGGFREYDSLQMYYVGIGGNYNTTTRMRRYDGKGTLQIVGEFTDSLHLLQANKIYHLAILVKNGISKFYVDGTEYFSFRDDKPLTNGWFAVRSTKSRQRIDNVRIYSLPD